MAALSWESFVETFRGRSYLSPELDKLDHPATLLLREWRDNGIPAGMSAPPWAAGQLDACVQRGCHVSATQHRDFLRSEMAEFIDSKFKQCSPMSWCMTSPTCNCHWPQSKRNASASPACYATTPGLGIGLPSMPPWCPTLLLKPCNLDAPYHASSKACIT